MPMNYTDRKLGYAITPTMSSGRHAAASAFACSAAFLVLSAGCSVHEHDLTLPDASIGDAADIGHDTSSSDDGSPGRDSGGNDDGSIGPDTAMSDAADGATDVVRDTTTDNMVPNDGTVDSAPDSATADADAG